MVRTSLGLLVVLSVVLAAGAACKKKAAGGGGGTVPPEQHKATMTALENVVFGAGKNGDGNECDRLAHQIAQEILLKATEGPKADPERAAVSALMAWGSQMGVAADDNKYSAAEAKASWTKLRDDNFAQAPWFRK